MVKQKSSKSWNASIIISYLNLFLSVFTSFVITPFLVRRLGNAEYGLYMLAYSVGMYLNVEASGIGNVIVRQVKAHMVMKEKEELENFLFQSLLLFFAMAVFSAIVLTGINFGASYIFKNSIIPSDIKRFRWMLLLITINSFLSFFINFLMSVIFGHQEFLFVRILGMLRILLRTMFVFVLSGIISAEVLVILELSLTLVIAILYSYYVFIKLGVVIKKHKFDKKTFLTTTKQTLLIFASQASDSICWNSGNLIVAMALGTASTGVFSIAMTLTGIFSQLSTVISGMFLPEITGLVVKKATPRQLLDKMVGSARYLMVFLMLTVVGFGLIGMEFLQSYLGTEYINSYYIALPLMVCLFYPSIQFVGESIIQAYNKYNIRSAIYIIASIVGVGLSFIFTPMLGLKYSWIGLAVSVVVFRLIVMNIYYKRLGIDVKAFFTETMPKMLLSVAVLIPTCLVIFKAFPMHFIFKGLIICVLYFILVWFVYMNEDEKLTFKGIFVKVKSK